MGAFAAKSACECNANGTGAQSGQGAECEFSSKSLLSTCKPALKAVVRSRCGFRRMFISLFVILIVMAVLYCWNCPRATAFRLCLRNQFRYETEAAPARLTSTMDEAPLPADQDTITREEDAITDDEGTITPEEEAASVIEIEKP
nr:uncharacterized protein LOC117223009 [Megalopta genalis]